MKHLMPQVRVGRRFFTSTDKEVKNAYECLRVNEKSVVGFDLETDDEVRFNRETGLADSGEKIVFAGFVPTMYDKLLTDAMFWVQTQSNAKGNL